MRQKKKKILKDIHTFEINIYQINLLNRKSKRKKIIILKSKNSKPISLDSNKIKKLWGEREFRTSTQR